MIIDFFSDYVSIQFFYEKMKSSLSLMGVADALNELLEELEWCRQTESTFTCFFQQLQQIERQDKKIIEETTKWIDSHWKLIKSARWQSVGLKDQFLQIISRHEQEIKEGGQCTSSSYLHMRIQIFEKIVKQIAEYGEFDVLKSLGKTQSYSTSIPQGKEPFSALIEKPKIIMPISKEGHDLSKVLNGGFIKAEVLPPTEKSLYNRNFITRGLITIELPDTLKQFLGTSFGDWRTIFDSSPARCLHQLRCFAEWRSWMATDATLNPNPSEMDLQVYYNRLVMQEYIFENFKSLDQKQQREEIFRILDRFLAAFYQKLGDIHGGHQNKEKAEKHVYRILKQILLRVPLEERNKYTHARMTEIIQNRINDEDLGFEVKNSHYAEPFKKFEETYGWPKKRGKGVQKTCGKPRKT